MLTDICSGHFMLKALSGDPSVCVCMCAWVCSIHLCGHAVRHMCILHLCLTSAPKPMLTLGLETEGVEGGKGEELDVKTV